MSLFTQNIAAITRPGIFLSVNKSPAVVKATGSGVAALVCQTPFGPPVQLYTPTSDGDRNLTYAPPGFNRLATGILAMIEKGWSTLKIVRVLGSTAATASATFSSSTPTQVLTVTAKYAGSDANSIVGTIAAASDGNANHFNLTVAITGTSGTTSETFANLNISGVGADNLAASQLANSRLVGSITKLAAGVPVAGSTSFTSGTNGTIAATDYVGTQGSQDKGIALLEGDPTIRQFTTDDCSSSFRATVNAGVVAHALYTGDRIGVVSGNSGLAASATQTDAANYQNVAVVYADPWVNELDDVTGATQLVPPTSFILSLMSQLPPSLRLSWRDPSVINLLGGIQSLQYNRGQAAASNTAAGITTIIPNPAGGFCIEQDVTTEAPLDNTQADLPRQRMGIYIGTAVASSFGSSINGPNVPITQGNIVAAFTQFLDGLKRQKDQNPFAFPYILDYALGQVSSVNTPTQQSLGNFILPVSIQTDTGMQHIIFNVQYGPTVQISLASGQSSTGG